MVAMLKVKARWHGFTGSPGWSNFFFREWSDGAWAPTAAEAATCTTKVYDFFNQFTGMLPPVVGIQVQPDVEVIEDTTGNLVNVLTTTSKANIQGGASTTNYSAASGAVVGWQTASVRNGRRVRGRTFIVPMSAGIYEANGSLTASVVTSIQTAAAALAAPNATGPDFGVYARPTTKGGTDGAWFVATGARVPDMAAILRSRRD